MSASDKKKLRKEQNVAAFTEKQHTEKKEQKKLKAYTLTFIIAMVLVVAIVLVSALQLPVTILLMNSTTALTIGNHKLNATEFNYFYCDAASQLYNELYNQFSAYGSYADLYLQMTYGLNPAAPLEDQVFNKDTGETWADYIIPFAIEDAEWTYAMYDKAMAEGFKLSEEDQKGLDSLESYVALSAAYVGADTDTYLRSWYGSSASIKSYQEYYEIYTIANAYASAYVDSLEYEDADYREYEKDKFGEFCSYSWYSHYLKADSYLTGGTEGEDGKPVYSDEEKKAAIDAAKADAESLVNSGAATIEDLNAAINALAINNKTESDKDGEDSESDKDIVKDPEPIEANEYKAKLYSSLSSYAANDEIKEWLVSADRKAGDLTYIPYTTKDADGNETVNGYYVLYYTERIDNTMNIGTVRHLLVKFEGGTKNETTGETVYTPAEKDKAKAEADKLLKEFLDGEKVDEDAFIELVKKNSDDTSSASSGGLIQNIHPDAGYVEAFTKWATADHKEGDTEVIESEYGYHVMYYVESAELNYRDTLIDNALTQRDYTAWEEVILKPVTSSKGNLNYIHGGFILKQS